MGYELKMLVVEKHDNMLHDLALIKGEVFTVFKDEQRGKGRRKRIYFPDRKTKTPVPRNAKIKSGPWCELLGVLDLCKCGDVAVECESICGFEESDGSHAFNPFDGDALIGLDCYGSYRKFVPIDDVIKALEKELSKGQPYRRFTAAFALLQDIKEGFHDTDTTKVGCLFYGH